MVLDDTHNIPQKPWLSVENITIRAKTRLCFAGTNWRFHADEQWAVIGPTGAGKSIFVKALSGHLPVVQGQIFNYFDGTSEGRPWCQRGEIILVSVETQRDVLQQHAGFHQARWQSMEGDAVPTVAEFLQGERTDDRVTYETDPDTLDVAERDRRRAQAIELLKIGHLLDRKLIHLSNGEGRKVLLARALMQSPKLLILDDPFSGLDADSRKTLIESLTAILESREQRLLLVPSREDEIPDGITHVLGIAGHQIVTQGPKETVCASSFARSVFKAGSLPAQEALKLPVTEWSALPPGTPLIEFHKVHVKYKGVNVLQDITWTMRQGEHWAIRGPNGAGKSTLLSLILADNPQAYANEVTIFGRRRGTGESIWDIKKHIGWVAPEIHMYYPNRVDCRTVVCSGFFDSVGLYQTVTVAQSQTADLWMKILSIDALTERPFQEISIGEQRLVLLARALVKQPRLLILDEPCQGLDGFHRARILVLLDALCKQTPVSLLYVTHHLDDLPRAITHVLHLEQGRMRAME
jgi:molybdate transport system ATP-binding protein